MIRFRRIAVLALALLLAASVAGAARTAPRHDFTEAAAAGATQTEYVVVTFQDPPAASYTGGIGSLKSTKPERGRKLEVTSPEVRAYRDHLAKGHQDYRNYLARNARAAEVIGQLFYTANAVVVKANGEALNTMSNGPKVRNAAYSWLYTPTMNVSTGLIGAPVLWGLSSRADAGAGIKVGIIDSGIDASHPFFSCKGTIASKVYASGVAFDPSNVLVNDHGTHVAGTVAGCVISITGPVSGTVSGVAPGAALHDYNVFPGFGAGYVAFGGSAFSHDIAAAVEDAVADGMDVINMSLGGGVQGPHDFLAEAVDAAVDAGVIAAVAAGNEGPGPFTIGSPGSAHKVITAGASTNPHFIGIGVIVGGHDYGGALGDFNNFDPAVTAQYAKASPANGCSAIGGGVAGKIAVINRGTCSFTTKIRNAQNAGAIGVLMVNNVTGDPVAMGHDGTSPFPAIPAAMVGKSVGGVLGSAGTVTADGTTISERHSTNADIIAGFSSRGPTPYTYLIKPDLTAPGVNIYSSVFGGEFAMFQGTSMATPHIAGSAALLKAAHPGWSPADVKSALVNTAARVVTDHVSASVDPGVLARGGGRVDLAAAHGTPVTLDPASVSFGYWNGNKYVAASTDVSVTNVSGAAASCSVGITGPSIASVSPGSISLSAGQSGTVTVTLSGGKASDTPSGDYSGDIVLDCGGKVLQAPWWVRVDREAKP